MYQCFLIPDNLLLITFSFLWYPYSDKCFLSFKVDRHDVYLIFQSTCRLMYVKMTCSYSFISVMLYLYLLLFTLRLQKSFCTLK